MVNGAKYTTLEDKKETGEYVVGIKTFNPATEQPIKSYAQLSDIEINPLIDAAHAQFLIWRKTDYSQRATLMVNVAKLLRHKQEQCARLMAQEMGKPVQAGLLEIEKCAWVCEHYAEYAKEYLAPRLIHTQMQKSMVCYNPLGVVLGIMPWNFPFWQVFRFTAPTLMAGNVVILKHASISAGVGNLIEEIFLEAGFPEYGFQHFLLDKDRVSLVIEHEKVAAVTLTGSEGAGRTVAANAGLHLKKAMLELGGNDPYLVLSDADLDLAAQCIVDSRMNNCGQVCIAAKRVIVVQDVAEALVTKVNEQIERYKMGDPLDPATNLGPMARADLRKTLHEQVQMSVIAGARLIKGGVMPERLGFYYPPTLLTNVAPGMPAFDDELFGPVIAVITAKDESEAIRLANQSRYGLGAAVFTQNVAHGEHLAVHEIEAGACFVNALVASDPRLPFGGIKQSGFGRELSREGILEFVNIKTVAING